MIKIFYYNDGLLIEGHANANKYGNDIYCAGVSAISQGALNWFEKDDIVFNIKEGYLKSKLINKSEHNFNLLNLLKIQLSALNTKNHEKYIEFNEIKEDITYDK